MRFEHSIQEYIDVVKNGIAKKFRSGKQKKVIIVGAGLAGLAAGYELKRAGHIPVILEAQQRVGGRVYTLRDPFSDGLYAEVGAMRIPRAHTLTMDNPDAYYYMGGRKVRASEANANPALLGFDVAMNEKGKTSGQMYMKAIQPLIEMIQRDGADGWDEIIADFDHIPRVSFWN